MLLTANRTGSPEKKWFQGRWIIAMGRVLPGAAFRLLIESYPARPA